MLESIKIVGPPDQFISPVHPVIVDSPVLEYKFLEGPSPQTSLCSNQSFKETRFFFVNLKEWTVIFMCSC